MFDWFLLLGDRSLLTESVLFELGPIEARPGVPIEDEPDEFGPW